MQNLKLKMPPPGYSILRIAKLAHGIADDALSCIALALNPGRKS